VAITEAVSDPDRLQEFDVLLVGCDFSGSDLALDSTIHALRSISAHPDCPSIIVLADGGNEYTAVQVIKSGVFDYLPKKHLGRDQVISSARRALAERQTSHLPGSSDDEVDKELQLFGYDIRRRLSSRENVSVHTAYSAERRGEVVVKTLHREAGALAGNKDFERFVREFRLLFDFDDPAIPEIYDFRVTSQYCCIAMEYFVLGHLGRAMGRTLEVDYVLRMTTEIARALPVVHEAGVIHLDLKPPNIMLRENGTVALIDFGLSQFTSPEITNTLTRSIRGTPYYMSPEQAQGLPTDERTDLYALGIILFQMLSGVKPFVGDSPQDIIEQHCAAPIPRLPDRLGHYQPFVDQLLAKNAADRIASASELVTLLDEAREQLPKLSSAVAG